MQLNQVRVRAMTLSDHPQLLYLVDALFSQIVHCVKRVFLDLMASLAIAVTLLCRKPLNLIVVMPAFNFLLFVTNHLALGVEQVHFLIGLGYLVLSLNHNFFVFFATSKLILELKPQPVCLPHIQTLSQFLVQLGELLLSYAFLFQFGRYLMMGAKEVKQLLEQAEQPVDEVKGFETFPPVLLLFLVRVSLDLHSALAHVKPERFPQLAHFDFLQLEGKFVDVDELPRQQQRFNIRDITQLDPSSKTAPVEEGDVHVVKLNQAAVKLGLGVVDQQVVPVGHVHVLHRYAQGSAASQGQKQHSLLLQLCVLEDFSVVVVVAGRVGLLFDGASPLRDMFPHYSETGESVFEGVVAGPLDVLLQVGEGQVLELVLVGEPEVMRQQCYCIDEHLVGYLQQTQVVCEVMPDEYLPFDQLLNIFRVLFSIHGLSLHFLLIGLFVNTCNMRDQVEYLLVLGDGIKPAVVQPGAGAVDSYHPANAMPRRCQHHLAVQASQLLVANRRRWLGWGQTLLWVAQSFPIRD